MVSLAMHNAMAIANAVVTFFHVWAQFFGPPRVETTTLLFSLP